MKYLFVVLMLLSVERMQAQTHKNIVLVIHGGAGTITKKLMSPEKEKAYTESLQAALQKGYNILNQGGSSLDAVEAVVRFLEDDPLFNAGRGAVFTHEGKNELDAAIMNGKTLEAGAVAGVTTIKNPVRASRTVMEKSGHVLLIGKGAETFATEQGLDIVDPSYFKTEERWKGFRKMQQADSLKMVQPKSSSGHLLKQPGNKDEKYGTVGAVALDAMGNLAAATSTGGMSNKKYGRVGDAPLIGAGTYADNNTGAISCTGWGEYFIRLVVAKTVCDLMAYKNYSLDKAAREVILKKVPALGGDGGLIGVDKQGNITMPFNTAGMFRGYIKNDGKAVVKMYGNE